MINILLVDDEPVLLDVAKFFFEETGDIQVETAESATDAMEKLNDESFDVIISDYQMPEMDGVTFLKLVRSKYPGIPFIVFTGFGREEVVIEALNNGADFYLQKGGDPESQFVELMSKVRHAVKRNRAEELLKKNQKELQTLFASMQDLIFVVDYEGKILRINPVVSHCLRFARRELEGKKILDIYPSDMHSEIETFVNEIILSKGSLYTVPLVSKEGKKIPVEAKVTYGRWGEKDVIFVVCRDITERKRVEEELLMAHKQMMDMVMFSEKF